VFLLFVGAHAYDRQLASEGKVGPIAYLKKRFTQPGKLDEDGSVLGKTKEAFETYSMDDPSWLTFEHRKVEQRLKDKIENHHAHLKQLIINCEFFERVIEQRRDAIYSQPVPSQDYLERLKQVIEKLLNITRLADYEYLTQNEDTKNFYETIRNSHQFMEGKIGELVPTLAAPTKKTLVSLIYTYQDFEEENEKLLLSLEETNQRWLKLHEKVRRDFEMIGQAADTAMFPKELANLITEYTLFLDKQKEIQVSAQQTFGEIKVLVKDRVHFQHEFMQAWLKPLNIDVNLLVTDRLYAVQKSQELP
jgi:hypothetical protein